MKDLISVIIPTYNRQDVIGECIASLQAQTYPHFEAILIDDGSADETVAVCKELAKNDSRLVLVEAAHGGVSAARNKGLDIAKGQYILFVDSDDMAHPLLLEELLTAMQSSNAPIAGTMVYDVYYKNWSKVHENIAKPASPEGFLHQNHADALQTVFASSNAFSKIPGTMMRRDWIGNTRFREDLSIGEDFYFIYENLIKGADTAVLAKKRYYCRIHTTNTSWDYSFTGFWSRFFRRELVWKSEEALGRTEYANCQKREAFHSFHMCLLRNGPSSTDSKKIRKTVKQYRKVLFPTLSLKLKLQYYAAVYFPALYIPLYKFVMKLKKKKVA